MTHPWCRDVQRDEAVRAAEDGRSGPLPTLEECIERQKHAAMTAGVKEGFVKADGEWKRLTDDELRQLLVIPKSVSATSAVEQENKGDDMGGSTWFPKSEQPAPALPFAKQAKCSPAVSVSGEGQSGMPTERVTERRPPEPGGGGNVTLRTERVTLEITHDATDTAAEWPWKNILAGDDVWGFWPDKGESVRVVEEAKLAPAANADGGSNHAAPAASGATVLAEIAAAFGCQPDDDFDLVEAAKLLVRERDTAVAKAGSGWLTAEERKLIKGMMESASAFPPTMHWHSGCTVRETLRVMESLLDRSSPPEVVRPGPWEIDPHFVALGVNWKQFIDDYSKKRDAEWIAALAAVGVKVKEVGNE